MLTVLMLSFTAGPVETIYHPRRMLRRHQANVDNDGRHHLVVLVRQQSRTTPDAHTGAAHARSILRSADDVMTALVVAVVQATQTETEAENLVETGDTLGRHHLLPEVSAVVDEGGEGACRQHQATPEAGPVLLLEVHGTVRKPNIGYRRRRTSRIFLCLKGECSAMVKIARAREVTGMPMASSLMYALTLDSVSAF